MSIFGHINELRSRILRIVISLVIITVFSMSIGIKPITIDLDGGDNNNNNANNLKLYYPYPDPFGNFALQVTKYMQNTLLPSEVKLIQTAPGQAFFANVYVSLLIGIIGSMPIIVKEIYGFISPAIGKHTKKIGVLNVFAPTVSLFIIGIAFSYILVIPYTLNFLYDYGEAIGVETFLNINEFISFVLQFFLGFGIAFELPVVMYAISLTGAVDSKFWRKNFRYAAIILVIFGALITPDGSGITMWFIALPMISIYLLGMLAIRRREKKKTLEIV
ncbi:MAG TPA: twin-arginine translocase subunit TatC [Nitrososphaeraceae archaeon]|nr:twin-arginine translocase subunit TatC [Nitrososphaeraceae archaeon]